MLREAAKQMIGKKNLIVVEVGVARGDNAKHMLEELDIKCIYLVDPYTDYKENGKLMKLDIKEKEIRVKLKKYKDKIRWIKKFSVDASRDFKIHSIDFVYIDANHQYEFVKQDIMVWYHKVKIGGIIGGHDYGEIGIKKAVNERFKKFNTGNKDWWEFDDDNKIVFKKGEEINLVSVGTLKIICQTNNLDREIFNFPKDWWVKK